MIQTVVYFKQPVTVEWTKYLYDGDALVAVYKTNTGGNINRRYVHGDQIDEPLVQYNGNTTAITARIYLHADHQGSIIAQSNGSGTLLGALAYDYGVSGSNQRRWFWLYRPAVVKRGGAGLLQGADVFADVGEVFTDGSDWV